MIILPYLLPLILAIPVGVSFLVIFTLVSFIKLLKKKKSQEAKNDEEK